MIGFTLYHGGTWKADSLSLNWIRFNAKTFHKSHYADDVFVLPHAA